MTIKLTEADRYLKELYLAIVEEELNKTKSDVQINTLCLCDDSSEENQNEK